MIYLSAPSRYADVPLRAEATRALTMGGFMVYDDQEARILSAAEYFPEIRKRFGESEGVMALLPVGSVSLGVPMAIERALGRKPLVVVADFNSMYLQGQGIPTFPFRDLDAAVADLKRQTCTST